MSFVDHGGLGKVFPPNQPTTDSSLPALWDVSRLRDELRKQKVWTANIPGNVEGWHPKLLAFVKDGHFTFEEFVEVFANQTRFDFGKAIETLLKQSATIPGGWYNSELAD